MLASSPSSPHTLTLRGWFRLIAVGLVLIVLVGVARLVSLEWAQFEQSRRAQQAVQRLRVALVAAEMVSRERGPTNGLLGEATPGGTPELRERLARARQRTDEAFLAYRRVLDDDQPASRHQDIRREARELVQALQQARTRIDLLIQRPGAQRSAADIRDSVRAMIDLMPRLAPAATTFADEAQHADAELAPPVWGARLAAELREYAGQLGSLFTPALSRQQPFTEGETAAIDQVKGRIDQLHHLLGLRVAATDGAMEGGQAGGAVRVAQAAMAQRYFGNAAGLLGEVERAGRTHGRYGLTPAEFAARYVPDMDAIIELRDALLSEAEQRSIDARERSRRSLAWLAGLTSALMALVLVMLLLIRQRVVQPLMQAAEALHAMGRGDLSPPLPEPRAHDEVAAIIGGIEALRQQSRVRGDLERERDRLIETLREQSSTDFLTGLSNRRAFFEAAEAEMARARRHGFGVVLLLLDVDHFKRVNDQLGHTAGDLALVAVAGVLHQGMRQGDLAARLGGEEFVALLSHCSPEAGMAFAERLREAIQAEAIDVGGGMPALHLTVSIGLADSAHHGHDLDALVAHADQAMYRAKHGGRNRIEWAGRPT